MHRVRRISLCIFEGPPETGGVLVEVRPRINRNVMNIHKFSNEMSSPS